MKKEVRLRIKRDIIVNSILFLLVLLIVVYKGGFRPFSTSSEWRYEQVVVENEHNYNQNPDIIKLQNGCYRMYTHGWHKGMDENNIYSFYSCDGLNWEFEGMRIKEAAMPAALLLDNATRIYFQKGIERNGKTEQALMYADSADGLDFVVNETYLLVTEEGELQNVKTMAHFEIVRTDDGYRIYFDEGGLTPADFPKYNMTGWNWPVWRIRSVSSADGLEWKLDSGVRIDFEQAPLIYMQRQGSCTVIKQGNEWHMYFFAGFTPYEDWKPWLRWEWSGVYMAKSKDGLNFEIIDKRIAVGGDPKIIKMGSKLRIYVSGGTPPKFFLELGEFFKRKFFRKDNNCIYTIAKEE
jgi:hypothetical protein